MVFGEKAVSPTRAETNGLVIAHYTRSGICDRLAVIPMDKVLICEKLQVRVHVEGGASSLGL